MTAAGRVLVVEGSAEEATIPGRGACAVPRELAIARSNTLEGSLDVATPGMDPVVAAVVEMLCPM